MSGDHRHEHHDGRRNQTLDHQAQDRIGHGIIQGKTTVSEAARAFDLAPSEIEE